MKSLVGQTRGNWLVLSKRPSIGRRGNWLCRCLGCGLEKEVLTQNLRPTSGGCKSCGQKGKHSTHGLSKHPLYPIWNSMMQRCYNPKCNAYEYYGGRGLAVDVEWHDVSVFIKDMFPRPSGHTLERVDNTRGYSKDNCIWVTQEENNRNRECVEKITYNGVTKTKPKWAEYLGISTVGLSYRLRNWPLERALTKTKRGKEKR